MRAALGYDAREKGSFFTRTGIRLGFREQTATAPFCDIAREREGGGAELRGCTAAKKPKRGDLGPTLVVLHWHDVAGLGFIIEMHLDSTGFEMAQHCLDPPLDGRMVCTVARDEFLDNGAQRSGRKLCVRYVHGKQLSAI